MKMSLKMFQVKKASIYVKIVEELIKLTSWEYNNQRLQTKTASKLTQLMITSSHLMMDLI